MIIVCLDLEGVLVPEIWIKVAEKTGLDELRLTTRDISDYDTLMVHRMKVLMKNGIRLRDIQKVISTIEPLPGAKKFLDNIREEHQAVILSDTFNEFAAPLMAKLGHPTIFCNDLKVDHRNYITGYYMRQPSGKEKAVRALKSLNFEIRAAGDSYNDILMLKAADQGFLFNPPDNIVKEFPRFKVFRSYPALLKALTA